MYKKVLKERWIDILLIGVVTSGLADAIAYFGGLSPKYMDILIPVGLLVGCLSAWEGITQKTGAQK